MRLLIYGFGPYRHFKDNVTERILRKLRKRRSVKKVVFPAKFHKSQLINAVKQYSPDVILGLGQCSRDRHLRIEAGAVNKRRNHKREKSRPIVPGGSRRLLTSLKLDRDRQARFSHHAGEYVCNYSMYVILDFLQRRHLSVCFGFIHIPHQYNPGKAARFLVKAIEKIERAS